MTTPQHPEQGDSSPEEPVGESEPRESAARYDQDQPGTVYPPINEAGPQTPNGGDRTYTPPPYRPPRSGAQPLSLFGFVCAGISLLFCPYLFGPVGIILGIVGHRRGESLGKWAAIASTISLIIGLIIVYAVFSGDMIPDSD